MKYQNSHMTALHAIYVLQYDMRITDEKCFLFHDNWGIHLIGLLSIYSIVYYNLINCAVICS